MRAGRRDLFAQYRHGHAPAAVASTLAGRVLRVLVNRIGEAHVHHLDQQEVPDVSRLPPPQSARAPCPPRGRTCGRRALVHCPRSDSPKLKDVLVKIVVEYFRGFAGYIFTIKTISSMMSNITLTITSTSSMIVKTVFSPSSDPRPAAGSRGFFAQRGSMHAVVRYQTCAGCTLDVEQPRSLARLGDRSMLDVGETTPVLSRGVHCGTSAGAMS